MDKSEEKEFKEEEEITTEEMIEQLKKLKREETPGENEIENEAWKLMSKEIGEVLWKLMNKIWKEGGILDK